MRLGYVLLSPTWGMHQYSADLANRQQARGIDVHLITTRYVPRDRYDAGVTIHTPAATRNTGFSPDAFRPASLGHVAHDLCRLKPDVVHFTGPHLWNPAIMGIVRRAGVPTVHTLHDLHPHAGAVYGRLLYAWNGWVRRGADVVLVHSQRYRQELVEGGADPRRVVCTWLTHLFVGCGTGQALARSLPEVRYEPWALAMGRLERYKGLDVLVEAVRSLGGQGVRAVIAGPGQLQGLIRQPLPGNVQVRNRLVADEEAVDLFRRCGVVVLPYVEASQSALVAAAYFFRKPVIVTRVGALPEYVLHGETGWVIPPGDAGALASALQAALDDPQWLAHMGDAGRAWYDRQRLAEEVTLEKMYAALASRRPLSEAA